MPGAKRKYKPLKIRKHPTVGSAIKMKYSPSVPTPPSSLQSRFYKSDILALDFTRRKRTNRFRFLIGDDNDCFSLLGLSLLAEPIPKGEREGTVVIVKNNPEPVEVIVMRSSGEIVKRFEPKGIEGIIVQIRLSPDISRAIVHRADRIIPGMKPPEKVNGFYIIQTSAYLVNLEKPDEPAKLILDHVNNLSYASWAPDSQSFYFCETDIELAKKRTEKDPLPYQTWKCSIPDGKKESIKIASQDLHLRSFGKWQYILIDEFDKQHHFGIMRKCKAESFLSNRSNQKQSLMALYTHDEFRLMESEFWQ